MRLASLLAVVLVAALVVSPALAQAPTKGLSENQLGPRSWLMQGTAAKVNPDKKQLVLTTEKGNVPLHVPGGSDIFNQENKKISLSDIKAGDRVLAAFHRKDGWNEVTYLYKPSEEGKGAGPAAGPEAAKLSEKELGSPEWVIEGTARNVRAQENRLEVKTGKGVQPLELSGQSKVHGLDLNQTSAGNIAEGARVLVSFKRADGKDVVDHLYMLPK